MTDRSISLGSSSAAKEGKAQEEGGVIAMEFAKEDLRLSFPCKLFHMLEDAEEKGFRHIVSWNAEGNGFMVHDASVFLKTIIPQYFNHQTKYKSFQRQLSLYGFTRIAAGRRKGLRFHPNFARGSRQLCKPMRPIASTKPKESKSSFALSSTSFSTSTSTSSTSNSRVASSTRTTTMISTSVISPKPTEKAPEEPENVIPQTQRFKGPSLVLQSDSQCSLVDQNPTAKGMVVARSAGGAGEKSPMISTDQQLPPYIAPKLDPARLLTLQEKDIVGCFEGRSFFLISTSPLEKQKNHPEEPPPTAIRRPAASTTFDPAHVASTIDDTMLKSQSRQAWEQGFAKALASPTLPSKPLPSRIVGFWNQSNAFVV
jgi:hypothetical protein